MKEFDKAQAANHWLREHHILYYRGYTRKGALPGYACECCGHESDGPWHHWQPYDKPASYTVDLCGFCDVVAMTISVEFVEKLRGALGEQ